MDEAGARAPLNAPLKGLQLPTLLESPPMAQTAPLLLEFTGWEFDGLPRSAWSANLRQPRTISRYALRASECVALAAIASASSAICL